MPWGRFADDTQSLIRLKPVDTITVCAKHQTRTLGFLVVCEFAGERAF